MKTTLLAATFLVLGIGSASAQTGVQAGAGTETQASTCAGQLDELEARISQLEGAGGGIVDGATSAVGGLAGGLGLGASGSADTPVGSANVTADASTDADAGAIDLAAVNELREDAAAALQAGDEERCLSLALEAEQSLALAAR